jgi:hypothetical protein
LISIDHKSFQVGEDRDYRKIVFAKGAQHAAHLLSGVREKVHSNRHQSTKTQMGSREREGDGEGELGKREVWLM